MDVFPAFRAECGRVGKIYGFCKAHFRRICSLLTPKAELVGAKPLHLADARPFCHLKAPLGLSLLRKREPEKCQRFRRAGCCGLWHPVSASTLGRVSHPAGHCPNNSSLFLPQAAVVVVAKKGLLALFNPKEEGFSRKYWRFTPVRREDLFTVFSASADLKSLRDGRKADSSKCRPPLQSLPREKAIPAEPQLCRDCKYKKIISADIARAKRRQFKIVYAFT